MTSLYTSAQPLSVLRASIATMKPEKRSSCEDDLLFLGRRTACSAIVVTDGREVFAKERN
jgi:hypothetical protein